MMPIEKLSTAKKGRILCQLFPADRNSFFDYLKTVAEEVEDDQQELIRIWGQQILAVDFWVSLARQETSILGDYQNSASQYKLLFAGQLFKYELFLFRGYCLCQYLKQIEQSSQFTIAVNLFFDPRQFGEL